MSEESDKLREKLFETEVGALADIVNTKFAGVEKTLDKIEKHLEKQNSSIIHLQEESNNRQRVVDEFHYHKEEFRVTRELLCSELASLNKQKEEYLKTRVSTDMLKDVDRKVDDIIKEVSIIDKELWLYKFVKEHPKVSMALLSIFVAGILISAYGTIGSTTNKKIMQEIQRKVNWIEMYERIPNAPTRGIDANIKIDTIK